MAAPTGSDVKKTDQPAGILDWRLPDSIYLKCVLALAISTVLTIGLVTFKSLQTGEMIARDAVKKLGDEVVTQMAQRAAPAIKFQSTDKLVEMLQETLSALEGSASGAIVLGPDGQVIVTEVMEGEPVAPLQEVAQAAFRSGEKVVNSERLVIAMPVLYGPDAERIGTIALDWRTDVIYAVVKEQGKRALLLGLAIAVVSLFFVGWIFKRMVAKPLQGIAQVMQEVADGNYAVAIPQFRRGNEIGVVARTLEAFRDQLAASEDARKDSAMKSAALDAGSAAIMVADADFTVTYVSGAVVDILTEHEDVLKSRIPDFDAANIVGKSIDLFHKRPEMRRKMLEGIAPEGHEANIEIDDVTLALKISKIEGIEGECLGYVVEWADVTQQHLNSAVLASLDENQVRAEFGRNGELVDANSAFRHMVDETNAHLFSDLVWTDEAPAQADRASFQEFTIKGKDGVDFAILGGLSPVFDSTGALKRSVLIGADVTEERRQKLEASIERDRLQKEQSHLIDALSTSLSSLAEGDLKSRIDEVFSGANDRIRQDFNLAVERLEEAIASVVGSANLIRTEVNGVASSASELSRRTESQAATLEETAAAISEISASVTSSADGARNAKSVVDGAQSNAESSGVVVRDAVSAMSRIAESSSQITSIVKVIDDIAFQTNLLALNAGVEAARAGDAGRGFAVVASEVRALAQRSSEAATEISALIGASSENVDLGVKLVGDAGEALEKIIVSIAEISEYVSQIAHASEEQSQSINEINSAMTQLDQVTQRNAAMFEETTAASQNLAHVTDELTTRVGRFSTREATLSSGSSELQQSSQSRSVA